MATHKDCGADIRWAKRDDDSKKYLPPLEYVGEVYVIDSSGAAIQVHGYKRHLCDPEALTAWQDYLARLAEAKGESFTPYEAARERDNELVWETALKVACEYCEAPKNVKCHSMQLRHRKTGEIVELRHPHPIRITRAEERWNV